MSELIHVPVMPVQVIELLAPPGPGLVIDATVGEGGHSALFLEHSPHLQLVGLDADAVMLERAAMRLAPFSGRFSLRHVWFDRYFSAYPETERPRVVLFDLGISMFHYQQAGRGFSFREQEQLDMRLDPESGRSAADIVNQYGERELADLLFQLGEERYSRRIAAAIVRRRREAPIASAHDLAEVVFTSVPVAYRHGRIHPATRTFQALRIEVNGELQRLRRALEAALDVLDVGGRLGVISFHSLEDRIVKQLFRERKNRSIDAGHAPMNSSEMHWSERKGNGEQFSLVTRRPLVADDEECRSNPAARSAKFRVIEKVREVS